MVSSQPEDWAEERREAWMVWMEEVARRAVLRVERRVGGRVPGMGRGRVMRGWGVVVVDIGCGVVVVMVGLLRGVEGGGTRCGSRWPGRRLVFDWFVGDESNGGDVYGAVICEQFVSREWEIEEDRTSVCRVGRWG